MKSLAKFIQNKKGSVLLPIIIIVPAAILIVLSVMQLTVTSITIAQGDKMRTHAQLAADAGLDAGLRQINIDNTWLGTTSEAIPQVELLNSGDTRTTYETVVADIDDTHKTITSTGRTYRPVSASTPTSEITIELTIRAVSSGNYSVVGGVGGLQLSNSSRILGGSVHVNGTITMSNTAQIGLSTTPAASGNTIDVGHYSCPSPADATYPQLCNDVPGSEPINLSNSATIYGKVRANNQDTDSGLENPGLNASSGVGFEDLPDIHTRADQINAHNTAVATTPSLSRTGSAMSCSSNNSTITWPANLKINGNVSLSKKCRIILNGDVWITGTLSLSNSASIEPSTTFVDANDRPTIMIDGSGQALSMSNGSSVKGNVNDVGILAITYGSTASCSPDCAVDSGPDLYNSGNVTSISMSNSAEAPNTILYAKWSRIDISNSGEIGALIGQRIHLSNSAAITFGTSTGVSGPTTWVVDTYRRVF